VGVALDDDCEKAQAVEWEREVIVLTIDEPTPSLNVLLGNHWSKRRAHRERWRWLTRQALGAAKFWERPQWRKARVSIERHGPRILDADNYRAGTKFLTDSLVEAGILADDTPDVIGEPELRQVLSKTERKTIIHIEPQEIAQ
jgi:hypothetical protein